MEINYSIIIPHKNSPELLAYCLGTIPVRDDVQVIVVDDNSDPQKVDFTHFPQWKGRHYEYYLTKEGKGAGYARNIGLEHATGKWLLFADADDFFLPVINEVLDESVNSEADIIYFRPKAVMLADRRTLSARPDVICINKRIDNWIQSESQNRYLTWGTPWGKIISHKLILVNKLTFEELPYSNDAFFSTKADCVARVIHVIDKYCYAVTESANSLTANYLRKPRELEIRTKVFFCVSSLKKQKGWQVDELALQSYLKKLLQKDKRTFAYYYREAMALGYSRVKLARMIYGDYKPMTIIKRWMVIIFSYLY